MRQRLANLSVLLLALLFVMLLGEGVVRLLQWSGKLPDYAVRHVSAEQKAMAANFAKFRFVDDPRLYIELDPDDPQVNSWGFRGTEPAVEKPAGTLRIAVIGDSVAFGYGLRRDQAFPALLEKSLQSQGIHAEVLNFSVSGYGLEAYEALYETKVRKFSPDLVILAYVLNDFTPTQAVFEVVGAIMRSDASIRKTARISQFAAWLRIYAGKAITNIRFLLEYRYFYSSAGSKGMLHKHFLSLQDMTKADHVPLTVFIMPMFTNFSSYRLGFAHQAVASELDGLHVPFHDLLEDFKPYDAATLRLAPDDVTHPNAQGQALAAQFIEQWLMQQKLLKARQ